MRVVIRASIKIGCMASQERLVLIRHFYPWHLSSVVTFKNKLLQLHHGIFHTHWHNKGHCIRNAKYTDKTKCLVRKKDIHNYVTTERSLSTATALHFLRKEQQYMDRKTVNRVALTMWTSEYARTVSYDWNRAKMMIGWTR